MPLSPELLRRLTAIADRLDSSAVTIGTKTTITTHYKNNHQLYLQIEAKNLRELIADLER